MPFEDKNILIVGGSSGICLQTAKLLQEKCANVITASRKQSEEADALNLAHLPLDVLQFDKNLVEELPEVLHGSVYSPGSIKQKPFERIKIEDLRHDLSAETLGAYDTTRNLPAKEATSRLSPHLRFDTVSVREAVKEALA